MSLFWGCIPPLITKVLITCLTNIWWKIWRALFPSRIIFIITQCAKCPKVSESEWRQDILTTWRLQKKITFFFIGNVMCNNYMFEFKNCIKGVKHQWRLMTLQLTEGPEVHQALMLSRINTWKCCAIRLSTHFFLWTNLLVFGTILLHCCWISHLHQLLLLNTLVLPIGSKLQNKTEPNQRACASLLLFNVNPLWVTSIPPPSQFKAPPDAWWDVKNPGPEPTSHHSRTFSSVTAAVAPLRPVAAAFCHPPARGVCPICSNGFTAKQQPCFETHAVQTISNELSLVQYWLENVQFFDAWASLKRLDGGKTFQLGVLAFARSPSATAWFPLPLWLGSLLVARRSVLPLPCRHCARLPRKQFPKQASGSLLISAGKKADILINSLKVAGASPIRTGETC